MQVCEPIDMYQANIYGCMAWQVGDAKLHFAGLFANKEEVVLV